MWRVRIISSPAFQSPPNIKCMLAPPFIPIMGIVRTMIDELRYWLARRCARHYAKPYLESVRKQGLQWTLELIDEDIELYGHPVVHQLAKVGCVDYAGNR